MSEDFPEGLSITINRIPPEFPQEQLKSLVGMHGTITKWFFNPKFHFAKVAFKDPTNQQEALKTLNGMQFGDSKPLIVKAIK